jgi:hypothetical protein
LCCNFQAFFNLAFHVNSSLSGVNRLKSIFTTIRAKI